MSATHILLIEIAVILTLARVFGLLMRFIHQPQVVGEMFAGILLGPSLLGLIHGGAWMNALFPRELLGNLDILSQLGVMLFMFLVGLELDPKLLRGQGRTALLTGTVGVVIPFICGVLLTIALLHLTPGITGEARSPLVLSLFMGAAMSITAFPVLARILTERNLHKTKTGVLALTCAAMDDLMGWCILAFVLAIAQLYGFGAGQAHSGSPLRSALTTVGLAIVYIAVMFLPVRKLLGRLEAVFETRGYLSQDMMAVLFLLLIASAWATETIGIHQIFGAFLLGVVMPKGGTFVKHITEKIEDFTVLFLLPIFFAYTGLRTELGLLSSPSLWMWCGVIIATAILGKFGGVSLAARTCGLSWRQSGLLGVLMNTRGLIELVILNIGLTAGVLSKPLFAMMVVMALATTFMTTPFMRLLYSPARQRRELDDAARDQAARVAGMHVVVPVSLESTAPSLVRLARMLMGASPGRLYALHLERPSEMHVRARSGTMPADTVLDTAIAAAKSEKLNFSALSFVSRNIGRDIADAAGQYMASWVVIGWHKPIFTSNVLGGVVGAVLHRAPANVAIVHDKGLHQVRTILVPLLDAPQDADALQTAARLGSMAGVSITLLRLATGPALSDKTLAPFTSIDHRVQDVPDLAAGFAEESAGYDLCVLALSADWQTAGPLPARYANLFEIARCSLMIVHGNPRAPVVEIEQPAESVAAAVVSA